MSHFQINNIYDRFAKDNEKTQNTTVGEVERLENNYAIVRGTAEKIKRLGGTVLPQLNTTEFDNLMRDLRIVLSLVRRELNLPGPLTAKKETGVPQKMSDKEYHCLCPLTVLLQAVASSLSTLNIQARTDNMGSASALHSILKGMESQLIKENGDGDFCAGLAHTFMIHEKNSRFTVLGSAPRYKRLQGLQQFATDTRNRYLLSLQSTLPDGALTRIKEVEAISQGISQAVKDGKDPAELPVWYERLPVDGTNITVTAKGEYKPACLTDYLRFTIATPPAAAKAEAGVKVGERRPQNYKACAEWLMVCYLFSSPDPASPPIQIPTIGQHKKAGSWPEGQKPGESSQNQQQQQQGTSNTTARPTNLPPLGTPQGGKGRAASPRSTATLVDRTKPAAANIGTVRKVSGQGSTPAADPR
ncbi:hypothetical protein diail_11042, partial [Diaporthe ilicicola]